MNKITRISLIIISSLLLVFFCYKLYLNITLIEKPGAYNFEKANIQERVVGDQKVLTEKNLGLTMKIPKNWEYEKYDDGLIMSDPATNVEFPIRDYKDWTQGCIIGFWVKNDGEYNENISIFERESYIINSFEKGDQDYCSYQYCEIIDVKGMKTLKGSSEFKTTDFDGRIQDIYITILDDKNRRIYLISSLFSTQVPECEEHFNDFINNLEIK